MTAYRYLLSGLLLDRDAEGLPLVTSEAFGEDERDRAFDLAREWMHRPDMGEVELQRISDGGLPSETLFLWDTEQGGWFSASLNLGTVS